MTYNFRGHFIEACDCFELCPCWVDDDPDEGHCTGLVAWSITRGAIGDTAVAGAKVVAVTTHNARRRSEGATTVVLIDAAETDHGPRFTALSSAFGDESSALADLAQVTGRLVGAPRTTSISIDRRTDSTWGIRVGPPTAAVVHAQGGPLSFDENTAPLTLDRTALHKELHIRGAATAQRTHGLTLVIPELGASGYLDVTARSGMSGEFHYKSS